MIPAPRFDYQAAATPGGIYQGLGALANAATTAVAVNRKAKQDQAIVEQQAAQEAQKQAMGLARIQAEDAQRARAFELQQADYTRRAAHDEGMMGIAKLRAENEHQRYLNPVAPLSRALPPEEAEYKKALAEKARADAGAAKNKPATPPVTVSNQIDIENMAMKQAQAEMDAQAAAIRAARNAYTGKPEYQTQTAFGFDSLYPDSAIPFEQSETYANIAKKQRKLGDVLVEKRAALQKQFGLGGLQPAAPAATPAPSLEDLRKEFPDLTDAEIIDILNQ